MLHTYQNLHYLRIFSLFTANVNHMQQCLTQFYMVGNLKKTIFVLE